MFTIAKFALAVASLTFAQGFVVPLNDGFVTDEVGILSEAEEQQLEQALSTYRAETSNELAILIIPTLEGRADSDVAVEVIRDWGIGTAENNNGVLLLHAYEDRRIYIGVGYGLEGALPDLVVDGIIQTDMVPDFQTGDYAAGFTKAIDSLTKHIGGEYTAERYENSSSSAGTWLFIFFVLLQPIAAWLGSTKQWWQGGVVGLIGGIILVISFSWWLSIPILVVLGLLFDYIVSKSGISTKKGRPYRMTPWGTTRSYSGRSSGRGFGGFGGGSSGGGGAGRSY